MKKLITLLQLPLLALLFAGVSPGPQPEPLVLVHVTVIDDANPLEDIRNTQKIDAVISNGRLFDRKALDKMLVEAQAIANSNPR